MEVIELTLLSPCVSVREYRGSAQRARGLEYKEEPPIPPLSGGEVTRKTEGKKGEDCPSEASSADPDGDRSDEPKAR